MINVDEKSKKFLHDIRIDKDGTWYYQGAEMVRRDIVNSFYRHLKKDREGRYVIEFENDHCFVEVEDTPFVIKSVDYCASGEEGEDVIYLLMPDDSKEKLDPSTLHIGKDNTLYCTIGRDGVEARFSRNSYYQIAKYIEQKPNENRYCIVLNGHHYPIVKNDNS